MLQCIFLPYFPLSVFVTAACNKCERHRQTLAFVFVSQAASENQITADIFFTGEGSDVKMINLCQDVYSCCLAVCPQTFLTCVWMKTFTKTH